jgi:twitching motility protein PilJ
MATQGTGRVSGVSKREITLLVLSVLLMAAAVFTFYYAQQIGARNQGWRDLAQELAADAASLTRISRETSQGFEPDDRALIALQDDFEELLITLREGHLAQGLQPLPARLQPDVDILADVWEETQPTIDAIIDNVVPYRRTVSNVVMLTEAVDQIKPRYEELAARLSDRSATAVMATVQLIRLERLAAGARTLATFGPNPQETAETLETLAREYVRNHRALMDAGLDRTSAALASEAAEAFNNVVDSINGIVGDAPSLDEFQAAASRFLGEATAVVTAVGTVEQHLLDLSLTGVIDPVVSFALGGAAVLLLILFLILFFRNLRRAAEEASARDARQQQAILELLDEITNLADGDLTVDVTVTEDFTGAIADSINYTVQSMRSLVGSINSAAVEIAAAAGSTQETARRMNAASERQAREITAATGAVTDMSQSLQEVAGRAEKLSSDAQNSVEVAHNGADTVKRTIQGMAALREQIQDTAKRIKRLGESSQEIGNIIEFINDISEQTNTLALNASIQAAMAGEQGRGFAVVADEVQRLAERASNATRQIETLIKTIQADTQEAITSMERSTTNVVTGAKAAEEAGQALSQMEATSLELARLMQEVAVAARNQSGQGVKIAGTMQLVREIAVETAGSAAQTAEAVGELNALSEKLRESVSGFKLPAAQT